MGFYYFAYGSNMLTARLNARCRSAASVARAEAQGFALKFSKVSKDGSGKATLIEAPTVPERALGVVFAVDDSELPSLDRAEGKGSGYRREDELAVRLIDGGEIVAAKSYIATEIDRRLKPYDWYLAVVIAGAREHGLDEDYVANLRTTDFEIDPESVRKERMRAIDALKASGFDCYERLLSC